MSRKKKRGSHARVPQELLVRTNERWSMDFMSDRLDEGILAVIYLFSRECLAIEADFSLKAIK